MAEPESSESKSPGLIELGANLAEARRAHAEAFLRYRMGKPMPGSKAVTDNQARAMADVEVDVTTPQVAYDHAVLSIKLDIAELWRD